MTTDTLCICGRPSACPDGRCDRALAFAASLNDGWVICAECNAEVREHEMPEHSCPKDVA